MGTVTCTSKSSFRRQLFLVFHREQCADSLSQGLQVIILCISIGWAKQGLRLILIDVLREAMASLGFEGTELLDCLHQGFEVNYLLRLNGRNAVFQGDSPLWCEGKEGCMHNI